MVALRDEDRPEALRAVGVLELVQPFQVEGERAVRAVDLPTERVLAAGGEAGRLDRAERGPLELDDRLEGIVHFAARSEGSGRRRDSGDLADQVPGEVDDVRAQVTERTRAGLVPVEAPHVGVGRPPLLQVAAAEVQYLADLAGLEHLPRQTHRRHEPVVEGRHVLDAGLLDALPHLVALVRRSSERLLAEDVLSRLGRGDRRLGVQVVRAAVVEQPDLGVADDLTPIRHRPLEPVTVRSLRDRVLVPPGDRDELRDERRRPCHVRQRAIAVRVRLAHERVAEHADADLARHQAPAFCIAASNAISDGAKSVRRTNASASGAPQSRSMPLSSHSIESGPW